MRGAERLGEVKEDRMREKWEPEEKEVYLAVLGNLHLFTLWHLSDVEVSLWNLQKQHIRVNKQAEVGFEFCKSVNLIICVCKIKTKAFILNSLLRVGLKKL